MAKTKAAYEEYLNDIYGMGDTKLLEMYSYLNARMLLLEGKLGTALRRHDPIQFEVGFGEWRTQ